MTAPDWKARTAIRERNRDALLQAAKELAAERGYSGTSTAAIATRAGVTTGALYSIFGSKLQLFLDVLGPEWGAPEIDDLVPGASDLGDVLAAYGRKWAQLLNRPGALQYVELSAELTLAVLREPGMLQQAGSLTSGATHELSKQLEGAARQLREPLRVPARELAETLLTSLQALARHEIAFGPVDEELFARVARRLGGYEA